jgi:nucleotide-binding universal stress UspA family protein
VHRRPWPPASEVKILAVIHNAFPAVPDPFLVSCAAYHIALEEARCRAPEIVAEAQTAIRKEAPALVVTTEIREGDPREVVLEAAEEWRADLIILGSHGYSAARRMLLGSVAQAVSLHATCSVEIVRPRPPVQRAAEPEHSLSATETAGLVVSTAAGSAGGGAWGAVAGAAAAGPMGALIGGALGTAAGAGLGATVGVILEHAVEDAEAEQPSDAGPSVNTES